jgi:hypothetical protein
MSRHGKNAPGKVKITFVATDAMKAELKQLAKLDRRPLSQFLFVEIEKWLKKPIKMKPASDDLRKRFPKDEAI